MVRIGKNPALATLPFIAFVTGVGSLLLATPASGVFRSLGAGSWSWPLAFVAVWLVFAGGIVLGVTIAYGTVQWDPDRQVAWLRGREVPVSSITEAWRSLSSGVNGAAYLSYRFVSTEGPSVRVLVAGRPMKGLDADDLKDLRQFVAALPLQLPESGPQQGLSDRQRAAAVALTTGGGKSRVGRQTLLEELDGAIGARAGGGASGSVTEGGAAHGSAGQDASGNQLSTPEAEELERAWHAADAEATATLAAQGSAARRIRRVLFRLIVAAVGTAVVSVILLAVDDARGGTMLGSDGESTLIAFMLAGLLLGLGLFLAWSAAADVDTRHRRRLGRTWFDAADDRARERGVPTPYLVAWRESARRLVTSASFLVMTGGIVTILFGIYALAEQDYPVAVNLAIFAAGLAGVSWFGFISASSARRRRADAEELVRLAGWRLLPPEVESR